MKLRSKDAISRFIVHDPESNRIWHIDPADYLTARQQRKMPSRPDMILQFSHYLASEWRNMGYENIQVRSAAIASLNGRNFQPFVDFNVDLASEPRTLLPCKWIVPLEEPLRSDSKSQVGTQFK